MVAEELGNNRWGAMITVVKSAPESAAFAVARMLPEANQPLPVLS